MRVVSFSGMFNLLLTIDTHTSDSDQIAPTLLGLCFAPGWTGLVIASQPSSVAASSAITSPAMRSRMRVRPSHSPLLRRQGISASAEPASASIELRAVGVFASSLK